MVYGAAEELFRNDSQDKKIREKFTGALENNSIHDMYYCVGSTHT